MEKRHRRVGTFFVPTQLAMSSGKDERMKNKKQAWGKNFTFLQPSVLVWLLLGIWLAYSAVVLWKLKESADGTATMCVAPR